MTSSDHVKWSINWIYMFWNFFAPHRFCNWLSAVSGPAGFNLYRQAGKKQMLHPTPDLISMTNETGTVAIPPLSPRHRVRAAPPGGTLLLHRIGTDGVRHRDARPDNLRPRGGASRRVCHCKEGVKADPPSLLHGVDQMYRPPLLHRHGLPEFERRPPPPARPKSFFSPSPTMTG